MRPLVIVALVVPSPMNADQRCAMQRIRETVSKFEAGNRPTWRRPDEDFRRALMHQMSAFVLSATDEPMIRRNRDTLERRISAQVLERTPAGIAQKRQVVRQ